VFDLTKGRGGEDFNRGEGKRGEKEILIKFMFDSKAFCLNTPSVHFLIKYCI
jgi:hypothetical protein